ncbi:dihydrofolate reductase [Flavobacterium agricola]|uniref:Dihydrofolate reductase n=1 Tax=Flavobacterium agricola TaxID=2870839 RepID=A0ABY6M275_9FLAO|nr:dihydrofolate reductase [Flavobacterium agricola]UYW01348.1 dihydrofolate reductase [Flavobacterium agricola]
MIILIAAVANNLALGKNNSMMWHLPNDFKHFKNKTYNHKIVMGRKTFESLPGVLPNRQHIIVTRDNAYQAPESCWIASDLETVLKSYPNETIYVIGGGEIYKQALPFAHKIELTKVDYSFEDADTFFPEINYDQWQTIAHEKHEKDSKHAFDYEFITLVRK